MTPTENSPPTSALEWAARAAGARVLSAKPLAGATSSSVFDLETTSGSLVLRLFTNKEWLKDEPDLARHEAWALQRASRANISTPEPIAFDETGEEAGAPAVLMTCLPGKVVLAPANLDRWLVGLAEAIMPFHTLSADDGSWSYFPYVDIATLRPPAWSSNKAAWERAIEIVQGPRPGTPGCFIHRDYHPNNVLWDDGEVSGIVDWVNACRGPAGIDVAWCRQNLVGLYGVAAADRFLAACCAADPAFSYDPFWDLMGIVEAIPSPPSVYAGWPAHGVTHLTAEIVRERIDAYLASILARF